MNITCDICNKQLTFKDYSNGRGVLKDTNGTFIGAYCMKHFDNEIQKIKEKRFVETYKNNNIYCKNGKYIPYWGCHYYFKSLEDVKSRIDNNTVGIYPAALFNGLI